MRRIKNETTHLLILDRGEEVVSSLTEYCRKEEIRAAWVSGLGALQRAKLGFYHLDDKSYAKQEIDKPTELLNLNGNVGYLDKKMVCHLHATLSDEKMNSIGGHLEEAIVAATLEIRIEVLPFPIKREFSEEIGLNLIKGE